MKFNIEVSDNDHFEVTRNTWLLNIAIVLQVLFGALTTGLSSTLSAKQVGLIVKCS